jgi:hypothetical protein
MVGRLKWEDGWLRLAWAKSETLSPKIIRAKIA